MTPEDNLTGYGRYFVRQPGDQIIPSASGRDSIPFQDVDGRFIELRATSKNALLLLLNQQTGAELLPGAPWTCLIDHETAVQTFGTQFAVEFTFPAE